MSKKEKKNADLKEEQTAEETMTEKAAEAETAAAETEAEKPADEAEVLRQAILSGDFDVKEFLGHYKALEQAKKEAEAKALRFQADFDNYRRRSKADTETAIHRAAAELIGSILPVIDNFERAWQAMAESPDKEGVGLISRQLLDVLHNAGLQEIEAEGKDFDPNLHHAVSQIEAGEAQKGKVVQTLQKGYLLNEKLLRAAMVQVGI
ncbi:MAG: nucleotide exchange factor GrpE [Bacillota bacterium]|nr:nucleotide exchange factor GrpE [Bacillota bacterium]